ncbi:MAG: TolC family protein [Cyclobacteriaceae bacterium]
MKSIYKSTIQKGLLCFGACLIAMGSMAQQDTLYINLAKLLEVGGADNLTIDQFRKKQDLALADLAKAKEWWLPEIYAGLETHKLWGAAMNADGGFFLDVGRGSMWTGLGLDARWDFGEGIYQSKAAELKEVATRHRTQAEKNNILLKMIHAYYEFLSAQLYSGAYSEMSDQADTIVEQLQIQVQAGIRFQSEMLLAKSNRNHLKVKSLEARNDYMEATADLVNLLNLPYQTGIIGLDTILVPLDLVPESEWRQVPAENTYLNRPEYRFLHNGLDAIRTERKSTTTGLWLPDLSVGTSFGYFGGLFNQVRPMRPVDYPDPKIIYPTTVLNASLMWRIPLGRLAYRGRLKQFDAQVALKENEISQFRNQVNEEVNKSRSQLLMASEQLELAEESQALAKEAVEQSIQRQQLGTAMPFEVFQAQEIYLRARLDYLKAIASYNKSQYSLYVALGNDL